MPSRLFAFRLPPEQQEAIDKRQGRTGESDAALGVAALNLLLGTDAKPREVKRPKREAHAEKPLSGKLKKSKRDLR